MNEAWIDPTYGRDHIRDLIAQADQERLARIAAEGNRSERRQNRLLNIISKAMTSVLHLK